MHPSPPLRPSPWPDAAAPVLEELGLAELTPDMAHHWSLALMAAGIPCRIRQGWPGMRLLVPPSREQEAVAELRAFTSENPPQPIELRDLRKPGFSWGELPGVIWSLSIVTVFLTLTGAQHSLGAFEVDWHGRGLGDTRLMAHGQLWRAVTSLFLHADIAHLIGNVGLGGTFLLLLAKEVGLGGAWWLAVAAGALANLAKIPFNDPGYTFLGASTAVFAALGALAGVRLVRLGRALRWRRALPFAAGLMILAFLGVGDEDEARKIDLMGHFFGFGTGFLLGAAYAWWLRATGNKDRRLSPWLGMAAVIMCAGAWFVALIA
ncbi:rhomboid family intramembrane serine protease [Fundidesulfovibrio soli]|uniref:rhomboid family intramembrane serine protease n=1 Tax=Fundidesulfovibrio soli TaxID=2922716 RepID=UPI001FAFB53B|nr:rhomboid family intramembrane serine protease [Fundidesulfovibrio soli]